MIEEMVPAGSTYAAEIDQVILIVAVLAGFWFFAAQGMFFWLLYRFRHRDGCKAEYITGDEPHLKRWVSWPHILIIICDIGIIYAAVNEWVNVKQTLPAELPGEPPADATPVERGQYEPVVTIGVAAQQWAWTFTHPGADNVLHTQDDIRMVDELHIEVNRVHHYELSSLDVLHSFSVPIFRLKQDAVPGRVIRGWFQPTITGSYDIQCVEMCGIGHGIMGARLHIASTEEHQAWVTANTPRTQLAAVTE